MKKVFLLVAFTLCVLLGAFPQTQQGYVKTKGRLGSNGAVIKGTRLSGAMVTVKGRNAVLSGSNGTFTLAIPGNIFYLQSVQKQGYVLTDPDVLEKQYAYSKNPLVIVLETPDRQADDKLAAERKIRRTLQRQLQEREDEIELLKEQKKLSDDEYRKQLQAMYAQQESNERLISDMADRYSKMDFDEVDEFNRCISQLILDGKLTEADSLINTKGDINNRADILRQHQEANVLAEQEIERKQKKLEKSKALAQRELEELAQDCYSKFEIFKIQYQNDSAAHYIALRASLDTTNVSWQNDAAKVYKEYLCDYAAGLLYCERALRHSLQKEGDTAVNTAICYKNVGVIYMGQGQFDKALEYYQRALPIVRAAYGEQHEELADLYISCGLAYQKKGDYPTAMDYGQKAYAILQKTECSQKEYVNRVYTFIGNVYSDTGDYAHAEEYLMKAKEHAEKEYEEFCEMRGIAYQNLGRIKKLQRQYDSAMDYYQQALRIYQKIFGEKHDAVGAIYNNMGSALTESGRYEEATPYLQKGLDILLRLYGEQHVQVAMALLNMGSNYGYTKQYEKALEYYWKSYEIFLPFIGADHPNMAGLYMGIGSMYNELGNYAESKKYILKCVEIFRKTYGEDYPYRKELEEGLEELETKMKETNKR